MLLAKIYEGVRLLFFLFSAALLAACVKSSREQSDAMEAETPKEMFAVLTNQLHRGDATAIAIDKLGDIGFVCAADSDASALSSRRSNMVTECKFSNFAAGRHWRVLVTSDQGVVTRFKLGKLVFSSDSTASETMHDEPGHPSPGR